MSFGLHLRKVLGGIQPLMSVKNLHLVLGMGFPARQLDKKCFQLESFIFTYFSNPNMNI